MIVVTASEILGGLALVAAVILAFFWWSIAAARKSRCRHDGGFGETEACDAICHKCGANLGFIGTWRAKGKS